MELKEFIKTVLVDIFKAIKETREQVDSGIGFEAKGVVGRKLTKSRQG